MSGNRGGRRPGAGRKPGSATRKTREIAERAAAEGITPLEVMLADMRAKYAAGDLDAAADRARDCAPYMHPRLSSISADYRRITSIQQLTDEEILAIVAGAHEEPPCITVPLISND
jgi:hypothetical protein